jgi:hypothetical protein
MHFASSGGSVGGNLLTGRNNGLINDGQFVFDPGAVIRFELDGVVGVNRFINTVPNGDRLYYSVFNGNRSLTNQVNVQFDAVNNPTANKLAPEKRHRR